MEEKNIQNDANKKIKKLIYVSRKINNELEELAKENNIVIVTRLLNDFNMTSLFREDLKAINNIDFLVLDLSAFINSTDNEEIKRTLDKLRGNFDFRIILIAPGFRKGNELLANCFSMGIYNIITASNDSQMYDQIKMCLSEKGMTYAQASQFRIDTLNYRKSNTSEIIKTNYEKVKQDISIGVLGITRHMGCTTWAINLLHFLNDLPNIKACLIETNNHNDIVNISDLENINEMGIEHFPSMGEVRVGGMEMFYDISKIGDIIAQKYDFYIYDFGTSEELSTSELASFLNKDVKFIILGSTPWEYKYMYDCFDKIKISDEQDNFYFIYNFTKTEEQKEIRASMSKLNIYFNEYQPDAFIKKSSTYLENILRRYLSSSYFEEVGKKKNRFNLKILNRKYKNNVIK